jgi:hypothetical protein
MKMIKHRSQLLAYLRQIDCEKLNNRIAVEALIFTREGKLIQCKRGPKCMDEVGKLEGIGGSIGVHLDLHEALQERIKNELGPDVEVKIDYLLEVRLVQFEDRDRGLLNWVVVSYLCQLMRGNPIIGEPDMIESLHELTMEELFEIEEAKLSRSTVMARDTYKRRYGLKPYNLQSR